MRSGKGVQYYKKSLLVANLCLGLGACGTLSTTLHTDQEIKRNLQSAETYCETIPRVYSGFTYSLCHLHARPQSTTSGELAIYYGAELAASAALDTVLLPYTIQQQHKQGSIPIH